MSYMIWMYELFEQLGPPPRQVSPEMSRQWALPEPPRWAMRDPLASIWGAQPSILATGELALAALVMGNNALFGPAPETEAPATVAWTRDRLLIAQPERLVSIARTLFRFYGGAEGAIPVQVLPGLRRLSTDLHSGMVRPFGQPVPLEVTFGHVVYYTALMVDTRRLPGGTMSGALMPILTERRGPGSRALIIPGELWPEGWAERWKAEG